MNEIEPESHPDLTVQVYMRADLFVESGTATLETVQELEADGVIDRVTIQTWPGSVPLSDPTPYSEVVDIFTRFDDWTDRHNVSMTPPFRVKTQSTLVSEDTHRVLSTPFLYLAVYTDRTLAAVYPHRDGDTNYTTTVSGTHSKR